MTIDILICTLNKGIVRVPEMLSPPLEGVRYVVSLQYTNESYVRLIPEELRLRDDVEIFAFQGQGLSCNRNRALERAKSDLVLYVDDDTKIANHAVEQIFRIFAEQPDLDVALFQASTYTGKALKKNYPSQAYDLSDVPTNYAVSTIEIVFRRNKVQGLIRYDERFGLGTKFLTCGEEDVWLTDVLRHRLKVRYFPIKIVETSIMLKRSMIYVDAGVQRSRGAYLYYRYGAKAWWKCFLFAFHSTRRGYCHFFSMLCHLYEGIAFLKKT